jgi:hypothetical protein
MHNPPFQEVARVDQEGAGGPTRCGAKCSRQMRIVSLIDEEDVIERILRHLGLGQERVHVHCGTDPPSGRPWRGPEPMHATGCARSHANQRRHDDVRLDPPGPPSGDLASRLLSPPRFTPRRRRSPRSSRGVPHGRSALPRRRRAGPRARRGTRARPACPSRSRLRTRGP